MIQKVYKANKIKGSFAVPGDKSISHRSLLLNAMSKGKSEIAGILPSEDVLSTRDCLRNLGVKIHWEPKHGDKIARIESGGIASWSKPQKDLDCGNSGTTIRLLMGALAGCPFSATLIGDPSLSKRPMARVSEPLRSMGAKIDLKDGKFPPVQFEGIKALKSIEYSLPVASAQLKSALILAGLQAKGVTKLTGKIGSRDHTERLLSFFGVKIQADKNEILIPGEQVLSSNNMKVPGDPSSAAFLIAAAVLVPDSEIKLNGVCLNDTRIGFFIALKKMGADIEWKVETQSPEPVGSISARHSKLQGIEIDSETVPEMIDEFPILSVLASFAEGKTVINGAEELRVKESDRIEAVATNLKRMGVSVETKPDGLVIEGKGISKSYTSARFSSFHDHRIAMAFAVASLALPDGGEIEDAECVDVSFPGFFELLVRCGE